jgi:hypothetical protein
MNIEPLLKVTDKLTAVILWAGYVYLWIYVGFWVYITINYNKTLEISPRGPSDSLLPIWLLWLRG